MRIRSDDGHTKKSAYRCPVTGQEWLETYTYDDQRRSWSSTDSYWDIVELPART